MFRRQPTPIAAARHVLFPELGPGARLMPGMLRAPRRGRRPAPLLSAVPPAGPLAPSAVLAGRGWETPELLARAAAARRELVAGRSGGAWWEDAAGGLPSGEYALIALAEPADGWCRAAPTEAAAAMLLDRTLADYPAGKVVVAAPRRIDRRLRAALAAAAARGAVVVGRRCDPWSLIERAGRVYSDGGELGFLALLAGVPVSTVAPCCYGGWGETDDAPDVPQRPFRRTVDEIFAGVCLLATRCRDPYRNVAADFDEVLATVADWRRLEAANRSVAVCVGMSFWKRRRVAEFVRSSAGVPPFRGTAAAALAEAEKAGGAIASWASRLPRGLAVEASRRGVRLIRVEDGFIRSKGLGSDFLPPASLVFDGGGIYYDPRSGSDLHRILHETEFSARLVARAERLAERLVARGITKYNLPAHDAAVAVPADRRCILVPGQVEDDLSVVCGTGTVRSNLALLAEVRRTNPDAFILYKPHPDVLAGHRRGAVPDRDARRHADIVVADGSLAALLARADELHTMTSLAGFEALLRGCRVVVYGRPFYAGWGLTDDRPPFDRGRRLALAELVAGALILYARYVDPLTRLPCGPEIIIERLARPELWQPGLVARARRLQGWTMRQLGAVRTTSAVPAGAPPQRLRARPRI
ncbi:MAG TPA: hypothetical protein VME41_13870 [Stellaceae bacterium]|nr:hypothetical protein [Stellaceae bacterium]